MKGTLSTSTTLFKADIDYVFSDTEMFGNRHILPLSIFCLYELKCYYFQSAKKKFKADE